MIKAIMAVDDNGGAGKGGTMPWPKNNKDLEWFKNNTINQVVVMGRKTWEDSFMPTPLESRINVLITKKDRSLFPGSDYYIKGDIQTEIKKLENKIKNKDIFIIGGPEIINQSIDIVNEFYLTRIYGNYNCDEFVNLDEIHKKMKIIKKIEVDKTCHFEIWKR